MKKPIIGILGAHMSNNGGPAPVPADYVNHAYCAGVENAGGIPILLPVLKDPADMDPVLAMCDGLLIPGGVDVDPRFTAKIHLPFRFFGLCHGPFLDSCCKLCLRA
mgnify:CR=1 FL=1